MLALFVRVDEVGVEGGWVLVDGLLVLGGLGSVAQDGGAHLLLAHLGEFIKGVFVMGVFHLFVLYFVVLMLILFTL